MIPPSILEFFTMSNTAGEMDPSFSSSSSVTVPLNVLVEALAFFLVLGGCVGFVIGGRLAGQVSNASRGLSKEPSLESDDDVDHQQQQRDSHDKRETEEDGPTMVLSGSLGLMSSKWGCNDELAQRSNNNESSKEEAVVEYLSPDEMTKRLFSKISQKINGEENGVSSSDTLCLDDDNNNSTSMTPTAFLNLLSLLQKYSVNTSHPYFFNQLFGSLDPIALAAEVVALSVNTSVYTYETAPVFTLLEREVMGQIGRLVFGKGGDVDGTFNDGESQEKKEGTEKERESEETEEFEGEGLMIPGGSLANLTAMHAARHRWRVMNGYTRQKEQTPALEASLEEQNYHEEEEEEKKMDDMISSHDTSQQEQPPQTLYIGDQSVQPDLVAFVSSEAHYSFSKSARVLGLREDDLIVIPTCSDGRMDVEILAKKIEELEFDLKMVEQVQQQEGSGRPIKTTTHTGRMRKRVPFFVACTAGSTVRGSFDDIAKIVKVCRNYESKGKTGYERSIWVHVDGAWGGSAIFSTNSKLRKHTHMDDIRHADSFTFNPHKMLGAPQQTTAFIVRHRNALRNANAAGAKYLFDPRKNGAEYDLGDLSYTCGRRTDAVKLWALWKYYGKSGLGKRVDQKVAELELFAEEVRRRRGRFALACKPWPFNVNFFYFPPRIRRILEERGVVGMEQQLGRQGTSLSWSTNNDDGDDEDESESDDDFIHIPDDIAQDLANVSVRLKLRLHEAGEMIIPYQPLNNQKADCFRLVLAGKKDFGMTDIFHVLDTMEKYGADL